VRTVTEVTDHGFAVPTDHADDAAHRIPPRRTLYITRRSLLQNSEKSGGYKSSPYRFLCRGGFIPISANFANIRTEDMKSWALSASSRARARYRYRCRVSRVFVEVVLIIDVCIATTRRKWSNPLPTSVSSTMMTIPITATVTGSGSKDRAMYLSVRTVSSPVGSSFKLAPMEFISTRILRDMQTAGG